ncbi:ATP-binding cassette domain-containing protein [Treponema sp. OMZ 855]|uniref:ATP-binding cassette domain-containing protein n=1 Tax=Treponema sp. OMZ 855 TaxID=1643512 RepID=UPI0020A5331C|nr:ATP-binding cassette domain-containing protein [Treponema sp. OMZ 855]UTC50930.1 ATP-binding cassette domain-containing protein [Treponema sp. OMZ 855]
MFSTENLRFTFPENGITAVDGVSIEFEAGKIHALLGENGAGKSTLARLCTGHLQPDGGRILYNGEALDLRSAADGIAQGLVLTPQHPQLSAELTVWENLAIGLHTEKDIAANVLSPKKTQNAIAAALARYDIVLPLTQKAETLDTAQLHWAAIGEALLKNPSVFFLDEPSASFSPQEITQLYGILRSCADRGACIIVVTHRIQEVLSFMDTVHILRNGKTVWNGSIDSTVNANLLLQEIFGSEQAEWTAAEAAPDTPPIQADSGTAAGSSNTNTPSYTNTLQPDTVSPEHPSAASPSKAALKGTLQSSTLSSVSQFQSSSTSQFQDAAAKPAEGLTVSHVAAVSSRGVRFSDFSIDVPHGKITGVVGIKKQGLELLEYLLVNTLKPDSGTIRFDGQPLSRIPRETYAYIPSKRMRNGIAGRHSIAENLYVRARTSLYRFGIYSPAAVEAWKRSCSFDIPRSWKDSVLSLSGGMIQKLIFSRELDNPPPQLVICAEPYWGLDRKVQLALLQRLRNLAENGAAVIVLTSDVDAALETCDRIHVLYRGVLTRFMERSAYNRAEIIAAMMQASKDE